MLFDTSVIVDYLRGERRAREAVETAVHRSISVLSWVEVMSAAPAGTEEATRLFLRSFERLAINEAIADEAATLLRGKPALAHHRAITWATARVNKLTFVTADLDGVDLRAPGVVVPYRRDAGRAGGEETTSVLSRKGRAHAAA